MNRRSSRKPHEMAASPYLQGTSDDLCIKLSPFHGRQLAKWLRPEIANSSGPMVAQHLESIEYKLADANALALWLRENVFLELLPSEAEMLMEAIGREQQGWARELHKALTEDLVRQGSNLLPTPVGANRP